MTLYVGIDVAKNKHDLACIDSDGEILIKNFRFQNIYQGFQALKSQLEQLDSDKRNLHIALEDTGHYAQNLVTFLQSLDYPVFTYNPLLIKEFVKSQTLRKTKTDKKMHLQSLVNLAQTMFQNVIVQMKRLMNSKN